MTIVIISLTIVALLGAFTEIIKSSQSHRQLTSLDAALKNFTETATNQIELSQNLTSIAPIFNNCYSLSGTASSSSQIAYGPPSGSPGTNIPINYVPPNNVTITATATPEYFNETGSNVSCSTSSQLQLPQMLTVTATATGTTLTETLSFIVTNPSFVEASYWTPTFTVTFHGNGGLTNSGSATYTQSANTSTTLAPNTFSCPSACAGNTFTGWNTVSTAIGGTAYAGGATYPFTSNVDLWAQWG